MKVKKRLLVSTLTMLCIMAQVGSPVALAASNKDITALINEVGHEISVVVEEDTIQSQSVGVSSSRTSRGLSGYTVSKTTKTSSNTNTGFSSSKTSGSTTEATNKKGTYSMDGRYYYGGYTGTEYKTTKYLSEQHPELKKDLEEMFGVDNLIFNDRTYRYNTSLWDVLIRDKNPVNKAINSKSMRLKLGSIGVENKLQKKNDYAASHLVPLFTYYGVINTDDGLLDYTHSTSDYLSREQAALMLGRFKHPRAYFDLVQQERYRSQDLVDILGEDNGYLNYVINYKGDMLLSDGEYGLTEEDLQAPMTRLEFVHMLMSYFPADVKEAALSRKSIVDIFSDIDKDDIVTEKWAQSKGLVDSEGFSKNDNKTFREMLKAKKIGMGGEDASVEAAYKLGILKKDSKGRANLFKPITKSQALRMLADAANAVAKDKSITYGN